jgi:hypothetical protein
MKWPLANASGHRAKIRDWDLQFVSPRLTSSISLPAQMWSRNTLSCAQYADAVTFATHRGIPGLCNKNAQPRLTRSSGTSVARRRLSRVVMLQPENFKRGVFARSDRDHDDRTGTIRRHAAGTGLDRSCASYCGIDPARGGGRRTQRCGLAMRCARGIADHAAALSTRFPLPHGEEARLRRLEP